jgi:hypothetical protein
MKKQCYRIGRERERETERERERGRKREKEKEPADTLYLGHLRLFGPRPDAN